MPTMKRERNYLKGMNMMDARVWFRYRCKTTALIKSNKSSIYKDNMQCRLCNSGKDETQDHLERCDFTREMRTNLNLGKLEDKVVLWRKITRAVQNLYITNKNVNKESSTHSENYSTIIESETRLNPDKPSYVLPVLSEETCPGGHEGNTTHAVEALVPGT